MMCIIHIIGEYKSYIRPVRGGPGGYKGNERMTKGERHSAQKQNRSGMVLIIVVVLILMAVLLSRCVALEHRNEAFADEISQLNEQITEEEGRTEKIKAYKNYTNTDSYVEKTAREKFGLVYPDEVIYRPEG